VYQFTIRHTAQACKTIKQVFVGENTDVELTRTKSIKWRKEL